MSNARKLVSVSSPTLVLKRSDVFPRPNANDATVAPPGSAISSEPKSAPAPAYSGLGTRLSAFVALCGVATALSYGAYSLYACSRDSFAVPTILSPSSDVVVAATLKLSELRVERVRAVAEIEGIDADLGGSDEALTQLQALKRTTDGAVHWTTRMTSQKAGESAVELAALADQKRVIGEMLAAQQDLTGKARKDVEAGLISRSEYSRQEQALNQVQLALLDNTRAVSRGKSALQENQLAQQALSRHTAPQMPELVTRQEQMIRVDLEIVRVEADKRAKTAERNALVERVAQLDEMVQQIEERPLFQAQERELELAFVPYTQLGGVKPGAQVVSCLWGLVWCHTVGRVSELVPGEVVQADPWGSHTRGEYVVLQLEDHEAARAKTLRIRSWGEAADAASRPQVKPQAAASGS